MAYDPQAQRSARAIFGSRITLAGHSYDALKGADALGILTEWNEFRSLDLARFKSAMRTPVFVDLRNVYEPGEMAARGYRYVPVGRPSVEA